VRLPFLKGIRCGCFLGILISMACATSSSAQERIILVGSGSNLPVHLYRAWTEAFNKENSQIRVEYLPLGSSEGIKQISNGSGDFGAGEIPLSRAQMHGSMQSLLPIPLSLVSIVPIYNLPGNPQLNFTGEVLGQIYLGTVKRWNDRRIAEINQSADLPDLPIHVVHRGPGKGSNYMFSNFLSKKNPQFGIKVGKSPSPDWPLGKSVERGQDMVEEVAATEGAIGYVETNFLKPNLGIGRVQNAAGYFVLATRETTEAACNATMESLGWSPQADMTNAPGKDSYPITSFTWAYIPSSGLSSVRRSALKKFLRWSLQRGQQLAEEMGYPPLPDRVISESLKQIDSM
jgi:phosphate transport system substrate-binding protein